MTLIDSRAFAWPEGKRAALSITFDDAHPCQIDLALPILDAYNLPATFYVLPNHLAMRLPEWRRLAKSHHEIGCHTLTHPCSGNSEWTRGNALEDYTLSRIEEDILMANRILRSILGITPKTFAYPCGMKFVGRGIGVQSYVPLIAQLFQTGRGFRDEYLNDPLFCDPAQLGAIHIDGMCFAQILSWLQEAIIEGHWLIVVIHHLHHHAGDRLTTDVTAFADLCRMVADPNSGFWVQPITPISDYLLQHSRRA